MRKPILLSITGLALLSAQAAFAQVVDPGTPVGGVSQRDWAIRWYQWNLPLGVATNPALDPTGAQAFRGDVDPDVFFLAGVWGGGVSQVERRISVPAGKHLFFPLINWFVDNTNVPGQPPTSFTATGMLTGDFGVNIIKSMDNATGFATLNGVSLVNPLAGRHTLGDPGFSVTYTDPDNIPGFFGADASLNTGVYPSTVSPTGGDSYFLMLAPLQAGHYTLHFGGQGDLLDVNDQAVGNFGQDITYRMVVTAAPEPGTLALAGVGAVALVLARRRRSVKQGN